MRPRMRAPGARISILNAAGGAKMRCAARVSGRRGYAAAYRSATLPQSTTFHHALRYSGRRFWYLR